MSTLAMLHLLAAVDAAMPAADDRVVVPMPDGWRLDAADTGLALAHARARGFVTSCGRPMVTIAGYAWARATLAPLMQMAEPRARIPGRLPGQRSVAEMLAEARARIDAADAAEAAAHG